LQEFVALNPSYVAKPCGLSLAIGLACFMQLADCYELILIRDKLGIQISEGTGNKKKKLRARKKKIL